jgi:hypothetical protein
VTTKEDFEAGPAARAWEMMLAEENPMPPQAAVDWVRDVSGVEDTRIIKDALFLTAHRKLDRIRTDTLGTSEQSRSATACRLLAVGLFDDAEEEIRPLLEIPGVPHYDQFENTFALCLAACRVIAEQP